MYLRNQFTCPVEIILDMIRGKWKPIIIWRLRFGPKQLSKLQRDIVGINQKMLIQHIKELQEYGIVAKNVYDGYPLKVEYYLTEMGVRIVQGLEIFQQIGHDYIAQVGPEKFEMKKI